MLMQECWLQHLGVQETKTKDVQLPPQNASAKLRKSPGSLSLSSWQCASQGVKMSTGVCTVCSTRLSAQKITLSISSARNVCSKTSSVHNVEAQDHNRIVLCLPHICDDSTLATGRGCCRLPPDTHSANRNKKCQQGNIPATSW